MIYLPLLIALMIYKREFLLSVYSILQHRVMLYFDTGRYINMKVIEINYRLNGKKYIIHIPKNNSLSLAMNNTQIYFDDTLVNIQPGVNLLVSPNQLGKNVFVKNFKDTIKFDKEEKENVNLNFLLSSSDE